ncbi:Uncharacterised protein [Enterobacter hormaechei]|nr:Uncharacterised protein [Enterobacter hormaechei]
MHTSLLDVLHNAANQHHFAVADSVNVDFNRVVEEAVEQHWRIVGNAHRRLEVATQVGFVIDDFHRTAAQYVGWTHHQRVTNLFRFLNGHFNRGHGGVRRLFQLETINCLLETLAVFRTVNSVRAGADDRHTCCFQRTRQLQRSLAAILHDHAFRLLDAHDFKHVFQRNRLEVEAVGSVVVGRDGFRVTVDHDGLVTVFAQRQRGMHAAVVELNALADTVWTAAQHHNLVAVDGRVRLALVFIGGVHVRGIGRELCRTGVHALVNRVQVILVAQLADLRFTYARQFSQTRIGEAFTLQHAQEVCVQAVDAQLCHFLFQTHQLFNLHQEPAVDVSQVKYAVDREARTEGIGDVPDTLCARVFQLAADFGQCFRVVQADFRVKAGRAHFQATQRFLQGFLLRAANRHDFTNGFHLGSQTVVRAGEFLEIKARNFGHNVVDGRFEGRWRAATGDVVHQLVKGVTHRQFRRHFRNREAGGFGGQRGGTGHARVHFDNNQTAGFRVHRELHVRAAGFHADFTQYRHRGVTHDLVLFVGQRLSWRNGDGVAGVDPHRVEVFDGADDDAVVVFITHHFHLVLFPANQRFINQQLFGWGEIQTAFANLFELFAVVGDTAAGAAHSE